MLALSFDPGHVLTEEERSLAVSIAGLAAQALDRAGQYEAERSIAGTLQRSFLPERLPRIPRLRLAARYEAAGPDVQIGGDWYDVDGARGVGTVGVGRGRRGRARHPSAATVMGQARGRPRRRTRWNGRGPGGVLALAGRLISSCTRRRHGFDLRRLFIVGGPPIGIVLPDTPAPGILRR